MKKKIIIIISTLVVIFIILIILSIIISFKVVRQNTDKINLSLKHEFQNIVRIPEVIPPDTRTFGTTTYRWEMITKEKETVTVKFTHATAFDKNSSTMLAVLEMDPGQDPSVFEKVLPAVIADKQAMDSVSDPKHQNLGENTQLGYKKLSLEPIEGRDGQFSRISWEFDKNEIVQKNQNLYNKLYKYPLLILRYLYGLQGLIIDLFKS